MTKFQARKRERGRVAPYQGTLYSRPLEVSSPQAGTRPVSRAELAMNLFMYYQFQALKRVRGQSVEI